MDCMPNTIVTFACKVIDDNHRQSRMRYSFDDIPQSISFSLLANSERPNWDTLMRAEQQDSSDNGQRCLLHTRYLKWALREPRPIGCPERICNHRQELRNENRAAKIELPLIEAVIFKTRQLFRARRCALDTMSVYKCAQCLARDWHRCWRR